MAVLDSASLKREEIVMRPGRLGWVTAGAVGALACAVLASCGLFGSKLERIVNNPGAYAKETVQVKGQVKERIDLGSVKYYLLSDGRGQIYVVTRATPPQLGETVEAYGRVAANFVIRGKAQTVIFAAAEPASRP
jgi:hypothetical protein